MVEITSALMLPLPEIIICPIFGGFLKPIVFLSLLKSKKFPSIPCLNPVATSDANPAVDFKAFPIPFKKFSSNKLISFIAFS